MSNVARVNDETASLSNEEVIDQLNFVMNNTDPSSPEYKEAKDYFDKINSAATGGDEDDNDDEDDDLDDDQDDDDQDDDNQDDDNQDDEDDDFEDELGVFSKNPKSKSTTKVKSWEELPKFLGVKDASKAAESISKWRKDSQSLIETQAGLKKLTDAIENMPETLALSVQKYIDGDDWTEILKSNNVNLDFSLSFDKIGKEKVADYYFSKQLTKLNQKLSSKKIEEEEYEEEVNEIYEDSKLKFEADKATYQKSLLDAKKKKDAFVEKFSQSITASSEDLKKQFPSLKKEVIDQIQETLSDSNKILSLIFNADGTAKKEAMKRMMFLLKGDVIVSTAMKVASKKGKQEKLEEITNGSQSNVVRKGGGKKKEQEIVESVKRSFGNTSAKDPFQSR